MPADDEQESPAARRDRLAGEFAQELSGGMNPSMEEYVGRLPQAEQPDLLAELVRRDHAFRWQGGDPPTVSTYLARFPPSGRSH
ncbi:MAG TPA: hypothetical protein VGG30_10660 [Pirellulales bacterium]|jgi:hypothetical protein